MAQNILTNLGEEYVIKNGLAGISVVVGLYNDTTDGIVDTDDYDGTTGAITTEPTNTNYAKATVPVAARDDGTNWGVENSGAFSFDFTDTSSTDRVDTAFFLYDFQAEETADGAITTHLIGNAALSQSREIGSMSTLDIAAGDLDITLD